MGIESLTERRRAMKIAGQKGFGPGDFSVGLWHEVLAMLCKAGFSPDMAKRIADFKSGAAERVAEVLAKGYWEDFYEEIFKMKLDFSGLWFPKYPGPGWRLLIIARGLTPEFIFQKMMCFFEIWKNTNRSLDYVVDENERYPQNGTYAIWVRDNQKADEIHKNKSAYQIHSIKLATETLTERLIHEFKYFCETGEHLDVGCETLCSGSRCDNGDIPSVWWGEVHKRCSIHWRDFRHAHELLRSREVIS
jgi:hypothetical protein